MKKELTLSYSVKNIMKKELTLSYSVKKKKKTFSLVVGLKYVLLICLYVLGEKLYLLLLSNKKEW